jgi:LysM repeat protein
VPTPQPSLTPTPTQTAAPSPTQQPTATATPGLTTHTVEAGDVLSSIAQEYEVTVQAIVEANELADPNSLNVGQVLIIPVQVPPPTPTATP